MIKAVVLDIGGVLIRTEDRSGRQMLEKKYALPDGGVDELVFNSTTAAESTIGKASSDLIWVHVADQLQLSSDDLKAFKQAFWQGDQIDQRLLNYLKGLKGLYTTALLSNAWMDARKVFSQVYQIIEGITVDHFLISSELGVAKPDLRIYRILAKTVQCEYNEVLFVDDFFENITAAQQLGITTIHYQPGNNLIKKIQSELRRD